MGATAGLVFFSNFSHETCPQVTGQRTIRAAIPDEFCFQLFNGIILLYARKAFCQLTRMEFLVLLMAATTLQNSGGRPLHTAPTRIISSFQNGLGKSFFPLSMFGGNINSTKQMGS